MKSIQIISKDLFDKVRSRFTNLEMGDETGDVTIDPAEARFFDFDFVVEGNNLGRVSMSLNDLGILKVYYSQGITENQDAPVKREWFNFLKEMRMFAMRRLLRFDTRDISKNNLDKNDFQHLATTQGTKEEDQTMNESRWNQKSSKKTSRAVRGNTEVIVRHAKPVEETYPGARSQRKNIKAIFIQNRDGERYKYPFIHTAGAFAMAQHVDHGGVPHDSAGKHIIRMSEQIAQLQEFQRQVRQPSLHSEAHGITERAIGRLQELKAQIASLGQRNYYESWLETFNQAAGEPELLELDAVAMEQYKSKFTETNFKEELAAFFPLIHSIMQETDAIDLEDYVGETTDTAVESIDVNDRFDKFVEWADAVEQGKLTPDQVNNLKQAVSDLTASGNSQPLGDHGEAAWDFFNGAAAPDSDVDVFSDDLHRKFEVAAEEFPDTDAMEVFTSWAQESYPELLVALGMSGSKSPAAEPAAEQPPVAEVDDGFPNTMMPKESHDPKMLIKEVAKIVKSFYNRDNPEVGPFRGGEGIAIDVEKSCTEKFGEAAGHQARQMAEAFMEKLTNEWQDRHGQVQSMGGDGLARLKELVGNIKNKVESIGDVGGHPGKNIMSAEEGVVEGSLNKGKISEVSDDVTKARNLGFKNASKGSPKDVTGTCPYNKGTAQYKAYWRGVEQYNEANPKKIKEAEQGVAEGLGDYIGRKLQVKTTKGKPDPKNAPRWASALGQTPQGAWHWLEKDGPLETPDSDRYFPLSGKTEFTGFGSDYKDEQGVAEGLDPDTQRLEQEVRDALATGDDYTAKSLVKMAQTAADRNYLRKIIRQEMYGTGPGQGGVAEATDDKKFDSMMGSITKKKMAVDRKTGKEYDPEEELSKLLNKHKSQFQGMAAIEKAQKKDVSEAADSELSSILRLSGLNK